MEAEKSHIQPFAGQRPSNAGGVKFKGLRARGPGGAGSDLRVRSENQESQGQEKMDIAAHATGQRANSTFLFVVLRPSTDWTLPTHLGRAICFPQPTNQTPIPPRNSLTDVLRKSV